MDNGGRFDLCTVLSVSVLGLQFCTVPPVNVETEVSERNSSGNVVALLATIPELVP